MALYDKAESTRLVDFTEIVRFEVTDESQFDLNGDGEVNILDRNDAMDDSYSFLSKTSPLIEQLGFKRMAENDRVVASNYDQSHIKLNRHSTLPRGLKWSVGIIFNCFRHRFAGCVILPETTCFYKNG